MTKTSVEDVKSRLDRGDDVAIIDSRSDDAWSKSDVKAVGAIRIPPDEAAEHIADVPRDRFAVVYCT